MEKSENPSKLNIVKRLEESINKQSNKYEEKNIKLANLKKELEQLKIEKRTDEIEELLKEYGGSDPTHITAVLTKRIRNLTVALIFLTSILTILTVIHIVILVK